MCKIRPTVFAYVVRRTLRLISSKLSLGVCGCVLCIPGFTFAEPIPVLFNARHPCTLLIDGQAVGEVPKGVGSEEPGGIWSSRSGPVLRVNVQKGRHRFECRTSSPVSMAVVGTYTFKKKNEVFTFGAGAQPTKRHPDTDLGKFVATDVKELIQAVYQAKLHIHKGENDQFILSLNDDCSPNPDWYVSLGYDPQRGGLQVTSRNLELASGDIRVCKSQPYIHLKSPRFGDGSGWFPLAEFTFSTLDFVSILVDHSAYARRPQAAESALTETRTAGAEWTSWLNFTQAVEAYQKRAYETPGSVKAFPETMDLNAMARGERVPNTWDGMKRFGGEVTFEGRFRAISTKNLMEGKIAKLEIEMQPSRFKALNIYPKTTEVASWEKIKPGAVVRFRAIVTGIKYTSLFGVVRSYMLLLEEAEITK